MKVKFFPRHFYLFSERLREINKAFLIKTRPSEGSRAISLLRRRKLKTYRQNQKEKQISFVLICKLSDKNEIYPRQMAFQNSCSFLLLIFPCFVSMKAVGEGSGNLESASGINLPSDKQVRFMKFVEVWSLNKCLFKLVCWIFHKLPRLIFRFSLLIYTISKQYKDEDGEPWVGPFNNR